METSRVWFSGIVVGLAAFTGCSSASDHYAAESPTRQADYQSQGYPQAAPAPMSEGGEATGAAPSTDSSPSVSGNFERAPSEPQANNQPGLGTQWGETRTSKISSSAFVRADSSSPFATASLFYNDEQGAQAMASASGFKRFSNGSVSIGGGVASMSLKDGSGRFLNGFETSGKKFLIGESGERYSIVINSHVPARLEIVVSVDGLDVLDGQTAGFAKRGYLVEPNGSIEIDGFRQSMETVAAFRFGSVRNSYSNQKHGETRNVGVIGVAAFNEQGTNPGSWPIGDTSSRLQADPFPGRFATPPH